VREREKGESESNEEGGRLRSPNERGRVDGREDRRDTGEEESNDTLSEKKNGASHNSICRLIYANLIENLQQLCENKLM